jgi:NADH-quinone oxidoreductase subunit N
MNTFDYFGVLQFVGPEALLVITALAVLAVDLLVLREQPVAHRFLMGGAFACLGCIAALVWTAQQDGTARWLEGVLVTDPLTRMVKIGILILAITTVLLSVQATFTTHVGEYLALVLLAVVGMLFMVSSEELLTIFVSLELTSLSLYILTAFNKESVQSSEAAVKYFLFGGMSAAFTLFGLSLIYGLAGSTYLGPISIALRAQPVHALTVAAIAMTVIGFGFKVAAAPFHLWAPDAYQGAPIPSAALIASGSKVAGFYLFARVFMQGFDGVEGSGNWGQLASGWVPALALVAAMSIVLGNLAAVVQRNVKRLLAFSAVAHAGYALLAVTADSPQGITSLIYYVLTYSFTVVGAFGVVSVVEQRSGGTQLENFAGLSRRAPLLAGCMLVFMLSLAGIPPLAGFFGKFYVFAAALASGKNLGLLWLVILALGMSAVSLYYYLQVLKQMYVADGPSTSPTVDSAWAAEIAVLVLALAVIILGCAPDLLLSRLPGS